MASLAPAALYGLEVEPDGEPVPSVDMDHYPATFRITMAAIDPTQAPIASDNAFNGATLKMIVLPEDDESEIEDDLDDEVAGDNLMELLNGADSDEDEEADSDDDEDEEEVNGGPSDPEKSPKALKRKQALKILEDALADHEDEDDMEVDQLPNGIKKMTKKSIAGLSGKGKGKAPVEDEADEESDLDDDGLPEGCKELVICTLDLSKGYQQPLDITISREERVLFKVSGSYSVHITGNYLDDLPFDADDDSMDEEDGEYDLSPDEDDLELPYDEDESDELDDLENPRVEELNSDEEEDIPTLIKAQKGKNKRPAEDEPEPKAPVPKDEVAVNGEAKLSKKQRKKLKANGGNAVDVAEATNGTVEQPKISPGKKVQFAETLVQGPTGSTITTEVPKKEEVNGKPAQAAPKGNAPALGLRTVQGVKIDDKKLGSGPQAKKGDRVSMRYVGKLEKNKVQFDANKKGPPFTFKIGSGQVIKGWDIGVAGMQIGGERRITVPPQLAYGSKRMGEIPPNSALVFDLKLLEIK